MLCNEWQQHFDQMVVFVDPDIGTYSYPIDISDRLLFHDAVHMSLESFFLPMFYIGRKVSTGKLHPGSILPWAAPQQVGELAERHADANVVILNFYFSMYLSSGVFHD